MQEDIVGTLHTTGLSRVETCSLCGVPYPADQLVPVEASPIAGTLSERENLCPDCRAALEQGDDPALSTEDDF